MYFNTNNNNFYLVQHYKLLYGLTTHIHYQPEIDNKRRKYTIL